MSDNNAVRAGDCQSLVIPDFEEFLGPWAVQVDYGIHGFFRWYGPFYVEGAAERFAESIGHSYRVVELHRPSDSASRSAPHLHTETKD